MAMGHPLPGLGRRKVENSQQFLRAASAPPDVQRLREMLRPLDTKECERITILAKKDWMKIIEKGDGSATTYSGLHSRRFLDQPTQDRVRPSSPTRLNKPHPQNVFLVTRLKHVKGCFNPASAAVKVHGGTGQEKLDKYIMKNKERIALAMEHHPRPRRPQTADSHGSLTKMTTMIGQVPRQATEAWIKLSNDKDGEKISKVLNKQIEVDKQQRAKEFRRRHPVSLRQKNSEIVYSANRWMKKAGREENDAVKKLFEALRNAPRRQIANEGPHFHITDYSSMFALAPKPPQYDFQIHPEWQTPWHKQYIKDNMVF